jgi:hypothetical protein
MTTSSKSPNAPIWQVVRFCCRSGMCISCKQRGNLFGDRKQRARIVHADKLTKPLADTMATNWREFDAVVELM